MKKIKENELIKEDGKGYYNDDLFTGIQVWENYNGSLLNEFEYNEGELVQITRFFDNGNKRCIENSNYSVIKSWYESGEIKIDNTEEFSKQFYESGKVMVRNSKDLRESFFESGKIKSITRKFSDIPECKIEESWFESGNRKGLFIRLGKEEIFHHIYSWDEKGNIIDLHRFRIIRIIDDLEEDGIGLTYCIVPQETDEYGGHWEDGDREYLLEICFDEYKNKIGFDVLESIEMESNYDEYKINDFSSVVKDDINEFGNDLETELKNYNFEYLIGEFVKKYEDNINKDKENLKDIISKIDDYLKK